MGAVGWEMSKMVLWGAHSISTKTFRIWLLRAVPGFLAMRLFDAPLLSLFSLNSSARLTSVKASSSMGNEIISNLLPYDPCVFHSIHCMDGGLVPVYFFMVSRSSVLTADLIVRSYTVKAKTTTPKPR